MNVVDLKWHHELDWRPWSYTDFAEPIALMVNGIRGQLRRSRARSNLRLSGAKDFGSDALDFLTKGDEWLQETGSEHTLESSTEMFNWRVGESLPEPLPGEIEIARVVISEWRHVEIATGELRKFEALENIFSIRARWRSGRYRYRAVDDFNSEFYILPQTSRKTLTLSELIELLETGYASNRNFECGAIGLVRHWWNAELLYGFWKVDGFNADLKECTKGARVESALYPMLPVWYDERAEEWVRERQTQEDV